MKAKLVNCNCQSESEIILESTVEPVLCGLCHERPLVLNDRFHRHGLFLIDVCTTCYRDLSLERSLLLGRWCGRSRQVLVSVYDL